METSFSFSRRFSEEILAPFWAFLLILKFHIKFLTSFDSELAAVNRADVKLTIKLGFILGIGWLTVQQKMKILFFRRKKKFFSTFSRFLSCFFCFIFSARRRQKVWLINKATL